jgi:uncharacterized protein (DUF924 family)
LRAGGASVTLVNPRTAAAASVAGIEQREIRDNFTRGFDRQLAMPLRQFFYLPLEHSEHMADQERSMALFRATGDAEAIKWAKLHADIIRRFGRFPHRNAALGRINTAEEQAFLDAGGFAG